MTFSTRASSLGGRPVANVPLPMSAFPWPGLGIEPREIIHCVGPQLARQIGVVGVPVVALIGADLGYLATRGNLAWSAHNPLIDRRIVKARTVGPWVSDPVKPLLL